MSIASFIKEKFTGKELCVYLDQSVETISYEQADSDNKEYFRGIVKDIDCVEDYHAVMTLSIENVGIIYINISAIVSFWEPSFKYYNAISASITQRPVGGTRRGK